ncbi:hypothetical protein HOA55_03385 [archaeon]|jgi:hypothetical protein|nr:hypothetical protein [archaeon]MBT3577385.1 hypothetical protein [archaeon]MBT6820372.1 hypothetical protein [archaeon]MBT6956153.1 hypothetical protein [archaeon]MBT7025186.1 hypothetical protein [archaeon]
MATKIGVDDIPRVQVWGETGQYINLRTGHPMDVSPINRRGVIEANIDLERMTGYQVDRLARKKAPSNARAYQVIGTGTGRFAFQFLK